MPSEAQQSSRKHIDQAWVAAIAREVIARLESNSKTNQSAASINDRVITADIIAKLSGTPTQLFISPGAIVTPAARDEARSRGITINQTAGAPAEQRPIQSRLEITDATQPQRAEAVLTQLKRRGTAGSPARVLLSETPGRDVFHQCTTHNERAVMIGVISDVRRFFDEFAPTVWVLDMKRLNITAATNVVALITQLGRTTK